MNKFDQARKVIEARPISIQPYAALMLTIIDAAQADAERVVQLQAERDMLIKTTHRMAIEECFAPDRVAAIIQNTPAPSLADVLAKMPEETK